MKTLVGVDSENFYRPALDLLSDLKFAGNELSLVHVDPVLAQPAMQPMEVVAIDQAEIENVLTEASKEVLAKAFTAARGLGFGDCPRLHSVGSPSSLLMSLADEATVDLVAIGAHRHGAMECFFLGSVGRALAIGGHQSFLVSRGAHAKGHPLHVIFATDHSGYANRCFDLLLRWAPKGIAKLTICTALDCAIDDSLAEEIGTGSVSAQEGLGAEEGMRRHAADMIGALEAAGINGEFRMLDRHPAEALGAVMADTKADLLVLGSRGHGIIERILIGSLALHIVVSERYPVLVMRLPEF